MYTESHHTDCVCFSGHSGTCQSRYIITIVHYYCDQVLQIRLLDELSVFPCHQPSRPSLIEKWTMYATIVVCTVHLKVRQALTSLHKCWLKNCNCSFTLSLLGVEHIVAAFIGSTCQQATPVSNTCCLFCAYGLTDQFGKAREINVALNADGSATIQGGVICHSGFGARELMAAESSLSLWLWCRGGKGVGSFDWCLLGVQLSLLTCACMAVCVSEIMSEISGARHSYCDWLVFHLHYF